MEANPVWTCLSLRITVVYKVAIADIHAEMSVWMLQIEKQSEIILKNFPYQIQLNQIAQFYNRIQIGTIVFGPTGLFAGHFWKMKNNLGNSRQINLLLDWWKI